MLVLCIGKLPPIRNKLMRLQILFIAFILTACSKSSNETIIKGTITGEIPEKIQYTSTINGLCNRQFREYLNPDSLGNFSIHPNIQTPLIIEFLVGNKINRLLVEPGKTYKLAISIGVDTTNFSVRDANKAQVYYNNLSKLSPRRCVFSYGDDISNYEKISSHLNANYQTEIDYLTNLLTKQSISPQLFELIKQDRLVYYQTAQSILASKNIFDYQMKKKQLPKILVELGKKAVHEIDLSNPLSLQACDIYDYLYAYKWYKLRETYEFDELNKIRAAHRSKGTVHTHSIEMAKQFLPTECQEFYIASYITKHSRDRRNQKEKEFLEIMEQFKLDYPNSQYLRFFEKNINKISTLIAEQK